MREFLNQFGNVFFEVILPPVTVGLAGLIAAWVVKLLQKAKIEVSEANRARLQELAEAAIRAAEELARRKLATGVTMTGLEKLEVATEKILIDEPNLTPKEVTAVIDSQLPVVRAAAELATGVADPPKLSVPRLSPTPGYAGTVR